MFRNLLGKEGLITTNNFLNPYSHVKFRFEEESTIQRRQQIHGHTQHEDPLRYPSTLVEGAQESWKRVNEEQQLEPEIEQVLSCLEPHKEYVLEDTLGIVMKDVGQGRFVNWEFSENWYKSVIHSLTSISRQFLTSISCEKLSHHV